MEKLNYEQLQKETLEEARNDYASKLEMNKKINTPMLKILFDYFNVLNARKKMQKEHKMTIHGFLDSSNQFIDNLPEQPTSSHNFKVQMEYKDEFMFFVVLSRYMVDGNWVSMISFTSNKPTHVSSEYIYKNIMFNAIAHSNLKGSYFIMPPDGLSWNKRGLEKRDFGDIYLPKDIMQDLEIYTKLFEKKGEIMRYLFAGTPGTGKTEATLAISNVLKEQGVTIIKTPVCEALKQKIELAELLAPCLIIFDDIDMSLGSRSKGGFSNKLGYFLDVLDGTDKISPGVGMIATTNSIQLLDKAASRPGRFDKVMSFDKITKSNIRDIILKSIKYNFGFGKNHPYSKIFASKEVVQSFYDSKLTGSHVFTYVKQILRKIDTLDMQDFDASWIIEQVEHELDVLKMITGTNYLENDRMKTESGPKSGPGFQINTDDEEDEDYEDWDDEEETKEDAFDPKAPSDENFRPDEDMPSNAPEE